MFEGILYFLISMIIAIFFMVIVSLVAQIILSSGVTILKSIYINPYHLIITIILLLIIFIVLSITPLVYLKGRSVIDSIKFE